MSSSEAVLVAEPASSLAGLIDVLDRADATPPRPRPRAVHSSASRAAGRHAPLRSVQPAPPARTGRVPLAAAPRTPRVTIVPEPERRPITGLRDLTRRFALWGSGPQGEYLAWHPPVAPPRTPRRTALRALTRRTALRALTRRIALWGAGPRGEYLAWGAPAPAPRPIDPPIVLREMPSTPTILPAATSPVAAHRPAARPVAARRGPASPVGPRAAPPPPGWPQPPAWAVPARVRTAATRLRPVHLVPSGPQARGQAARSPSASTRDGPARARGDPLTPWLPPRRTPSPSG